MDGCFKNFIFQDGSQIFGVLSCDYPLGIPARYCKRKNEKEKKLELGCYDTWLVKLVASGFTLLVTK